MQDQKTVGNFQNTPVDPTSSTGLNIPFSSADPKERRQALQTYFRSSFRVQMDMVNLADRKANILVRLNSLLISGMVIFYKNITSYNELATIPVVIFLLTLVVSLIFATIAVRPNIESITGDPSLSEKEAIGQMFDYTLYANRSEVLFEKYFNEMMQSTGLIYGGMARNLYQYGRILVKKYKLLRLAYTTFTVGLVLTVILFLVGISIS